jgi:predicted nucleotidyltransferase
MSNPNLIDVSSEQLEIIQRILKKHVPKHIVWAFGSRVQGKPKPYSDLDLAIIGDKPLSLAITAALKEDFSESDLPWKVDVVDWASTSAAFRSIIAANKIVLQNDNKRSR